MKTNYSIKLILMALLTLGVGTSMAASNETEQMTNMEEMKKQEMKKMDGTHTEKMSKMEDEMKAEAMEKMDEMKEEGMEKMSDEMKKEPKKKAAMDS